jgi:hypothetical protein
MAGNNIYVQGSYIDIHDNEVVNLSVDKAQVHVGEQQPQPDECEIPQVLADSEKWQRVMQAGLVDAGGQPTVSRPEAALIADMLAEALGIANKWKFFEQLWHRNNMRADYNTALDQRKSLKFQERLKIILG